MDDQVDQLTRSLSSADGELLLQMLSTGFAALALAASIAAVLIAVITLHSKVGTELRGNYKFVRSSIYTDDPYVSSVTLENQKDRTVAVYGIYIWIDHGTYIEVEEFEDIPLKIGPFETIQRNYDLIDGYSMNLQRLHPGNLFDDKYQRTKIIVSTSTGPITVKKSLHSYNPRFTWFSNHLQIFANVDRLTFNGVAIGSRTLYVVQFFEGDELTETIPITPEVFRHKWFTRLGGNKADLESVDSVKALFEKSRKGDSVRVDVIDWQAKRSLTFADRAEPGEVLERRSWFSVHVIGRIVTFFSKRRLKKRNKQRQKTAKKAVESAETKEVDQSDERNGI